MPSTYLHNSYYFFAHIFLVLSCTVGKPVLTLITSFEESQILSNNFSLWCEFETQDLSLVEDETKAINLFIRGNNDEEVILTFVYEGNNILSPLANISLSPGQYNKSIELKVKAEAVGHTVMVLNATPPNMTDVSNAFVRVSVSHSRDLDYVIDVVGWLYFVAWSVSFYPQTFSNWRRKSVIGLHFDFLSLNTVGFLMYSVFNLCLYFDADIIHQYFARHPYGVNPVLLNDVLFSVHAVFACMVQVLQCSIYEQGDQHVSRTAKSIIAGIVIVSFVAVILGSASVIEWLDFLYFVSYVKLFITLIKYVPQAYYNYHRKSTSGWSIGNVLLDFTGGILSIMQMFLLAYNYNDWTSIFGDPTKFGLGLFSVVFDIFFMIQHYVLYRGSDGYRRDLSSPQVTCSSSLTDSIASGDYGAMRSTS